MFLLYWVAIVVFQLSYRIGFLFPLDHSLFSMVTLLDSSWNAPYLKVIHRVPEIDNSE